MQQSAALDRTLPMLQLTVASVPQRSGRKRGGLSLKLMTPLSRRSEWVHGNARLNSRFMICRCRIAYRNLGSSCRTQGRSHEYRMGLFLLASKLRRSAPLANGLVGGNGRRPCDDRTCVVDRMKTSGRAINPYHDLRHLHLRGRLLHPMGLKTDRIELPFRLRRTWIRRCVRRSGSF